MVPMHFLVSTHKLKISVIGPIHKYNESSIYFSRPVCSADCSPG